MELNYSFNTSLTGLDPHFFDKFLVNLNSDPYASMFSDSSNVPIAEEQSDDYNYLEYIGPPMIIIRAQHHLNPWSVTISPRHGSTGEGPVFHSTGLRLSKSSHPFQRLDRYPLPLTQRPRISLSTTWIPSTRVKLHPNINLKLDESNIVPGKPIRAVSSRATEEGQPKEVYLRVGVAEFHSHPSRIYSIRLGFIHDLIAANPAGDLLTPGFNPEPDPTSGSGFTSLHGCWYMVARLQLILRGSSLSTPSQKSLQHSGIQVGSNGVIWSQEGKVQTQRLGGDSDNKRTFIAGFSWYRLGTRSQTRMTHLVLYSKIFRSTNLQICPFNNLSGSLSTTYKSIQLFILIFILYSAKKQSGISFNFMEQLQFELHSNHTLHGPAALCINFAAANGVDTQSAAFQAPV
ncbi:hypothetical protein B0H13DRAFT_1925278 [Mycena leptocephala]|nr:hypothetical protein B0H13DRAFT_1925278 [Mycena leptocephala]